MNTAHDISALLASPRLSSLLPSGLAAQAVYVPAPGIVQPERVASPIPS
jgi:hypothetical protein